ncbi:MAG: glycosyltransferase family 2 protein, partial [Acidimicrobiia bacterium]
FWGREHGDGDEVEYQWTAQTALLQVPVTETDGARSCEVRLAADEPTPVELVSGRRRASHLVGTTPAWYPVELDGTPFDVINNVGSELVADGYGADRGYLQRDVGQYDEEEDVFAWCGAAVLLRTRYLETAGLFDERLFLYYEDLELSWRGLDHGWRHRYVPKSVVRHLHSATTVEGSALAEHFNERNHLLVLARHAPRSVLARALLRYLLVTASYARRDLVSRWLRRERPRRETVRRRVHALASFVPRAPAMALDPHERYAVADPPRRRRPRITPLNRFTDYRLLGANLVPRAGRFAPAFLGRLDRPAGRTVVGHTGRVCRIEGWVVARTGRPVTVLARLDGAPV